MPSEQGFLVVTDFEMSGTLGVELIREVIRAEPRRVPVMALFTGHDINATAPIQALKVDAPPSLRASL